MRIVLVALLLLVAIGCKCGPSSCVVEARPASTLHSFHDLNGDARVYDRQQGTLWQQVR